ncbi:hypothetical protein D9619_008528 [Psilocybe cf. subviscida]|uniref:Uncharacterized protein n=1 Tax=Psilocybe cf. subviscida TaxID=2480587 RepID=A0A8H5F0K1_9AGAR|nr:hypothetical protein D9619_008528 [Psilocybe cf. subviscida]
MPAASFRKDGAAMLNAPAMERTALGARWQQTNTNVNSKHQAHNSGTVNDKPPAKKRKNVNKPRDAIVGLRAINDLPSTHSNPVTGAAPPPPPPVAQGEKIYRPHARSQGREATFKGLGAQAGRYQYSAAD